jgi:serine/threonine protein kinase
MPTQRTAIASPFHLDGSRKRSRKPAVEAFKWIPQNWFLHREVSERVSILASKDSHKQLIVKKTLRITAESKFDDRPQEIRMLCFLPDCNRILRPIFYARSTDEPAWGTAIFPHCPLGDLSEWKESQFGLKAVPESFIWRFFVHISQALAVLHLCLGPRPYGQHRLLHRDIKPENILVVHNGTTYPSFKLHDFGLACMYNAHKTKSPNARGTFEWQPPENPLINTMAADIWALGACVHYLALGKPPIEDLDEYKGKREKLHIGHNVPSSMENYPTAEHYYMARVPREVTPINLSEEEQLGQGIAVANTEDAPTFHHRYSNELNGWMEQCLKREPGERPTTRKLLDGIDEEATSLLKRMGGTAALTDLELEFGPWELAHPAWCA